MSRYREVLRTVRRNVRVSAQRSRAFLSKTDTFGYIGGQGTKNLGDEAMFEAARRLMKPKIVVDYSSPDLERRMKGVRLSGSSLFRHIFLGGGTLINPYPLWIEQAQLALDQGISMSALGTGVGSFGFDMERDVSLASWVPLLTRFDSIGVRGPRSLQMLQAVGISNAEIVGDLALSLTWDHYIEPQTPPCCAVNISLPNLDDYGKGDYRCLPELEVVLQQLKRSGWKIIPIVMTQRDILPLRRLFANIEQGNDPMPVLSTPEEFFGRVAPCTFTIAVRLHTAILSSCVGVPPLMLAYRDKCQDFMESVGLEEWNVSLQEAATGEILHKAMQLSECGVALRPTVLERSQEWRNRLREFVHLLRL